METISAPSSQDHQELWVTRWTKIVAATFAVIIFLVLVSLVPVGYVIQYPGPTINVLGDQGDTTILEFSQSGDFDDLAVRVEGEDDGELRMVTVSTLGGPGTTVRVGDIVKSWFTPGATVRKYSDLYAPQTTAEDVASAGAAQMESSHSAAAIAAMDYLGAPMVTEMIVVGTSEGSDAEGKLLEGDILVSIETSDGFVHEVDKPSVPFSLLEETEPGTTLVVTVLREGEVLPVNIVTSAPVVPEGEEPVEGSKMGIYLGANTELAMDVVIHLERVGGPSAGLVFALGIIDRLTPDGITGGETVAATGALDFVGNVIPIGGVVQKMYGAQRDGAEWFLLPAENCAEAAGREPNGLSAVPVRTLAEAVGAVEAIAAGQGADLPGCPISVS
ncbi:YlbL family protein [Actinomyces minihominis]|uniref:YlbL family protein n=1 Tax=Actinomyces minihominis TaxID=2002838 RepID=UPI0013EAF043|nr:S16 family serine protease [Actinomyces minihominis]